MKYPGLIAGPPGADPMAKDPRTLAKEEEQRRLKLSLIQGSLSTIPILGGLLSGIGGAVGNESGPLAASEPPKGPAVGPGSPGSPLINPYFRDELRGSYGYNLYPMYRRGQP